MEDSSHKNELSLLREELTSRSFSAAVGHGILLLLLGFFHWIDLVSSPMILLFSILLVLAIMLRLSISFTLKKIRGEMWFTFFTIIIALTGTAWGGVISLLLNHSIQQSNSYAFFLFILAGVTSGALYSVGPSGKDFFIYLGSILGIFLFYIFYYYQKNSIAQFEVVAATVTYFLFLNKQRTIYKKEWDQLINSKKELKVVIDALPGGVSLIREGKYILVNKSIGLYMGCSAEDIVGTSVGALNPKSEFIKLLLPFIDSTKTTLSNEIILETHRGPRIHLVVFQKLNTITKDTVAASFDVHDLRMAEQEIQVQRLKLQESAKMAALGEMSAGLAHEINNHLAIIMLKAQKFSLQYTGENKSLIADLEQIVKTTQKISAIVRSLKWFAREADSDPFEIVSVRQIIEETVQFCESRFSKRKIALNLNLADDCAIQCKPTAISQVILNLLNNAHDAIESLPEKWVDVELFNEDKFITIQITDSGHGIPEGLREKIMNPFFTTKEVGKGTGLGLSLSKGIIESHHGTFVFDFKHSNTRVVIQLPKRQPEKGITQ